MAKKRWIVIVEWIDGDVSDSDELIVFAETAAGATSKARRVWTVTNRAEHPNIWIKKVFVLTPERLLEFA
jgi:hypothetical protein